MRRCISLFFVAVLAAPAVMLVTNAHTAGFGLPPNPAVQAMVASVSTAELRSSVETLVGFHTRHTNSDTTSATRGIGATRNWIFTRLGQFAAIPGSHVQPSFFTFDTTICNRAGRHKNVLATLPGVRSPERTFLVAGHMDSRTNLACDDTSYAPGANDDATGTALAIELARVMSRHRFGCEVVLMATTGDEQGIYGSSAYAAWALANAKRIDGMISVDIIGNVTGCSNPSCPLESTPVTDSTSVRHFAAGPSTSIHRQLARAMKLNAARYVPGFEVGLVPARDRAGRGGDHMAFDVRGYPAARFTEAVEFGDGSGNNGRQHNEHDGIEAVDFEYVANVAKVTLAGTASLALAPETPEAPAVEPLADGSVRLTWPSLTTAAPLGYRVALRDTAADSTFYFGILEAGSDSGAVQSLILASGVRRPIHVSVSAYDANFNESRFSEEVLIPGAVTGVEAWPAVTAGRLRRASPNPASRAVQLGFDLTRRGSVALQIYDLEGRLVRRWNAHDFEAGTYDVSWDAKDGAGRIVRGGVYLVRMLVDGRAVDVRKLVRLE